MNQKTSFLFDRWPRFASRHPWRVLGGAAVLIALIFAINTALGGEFSDSFSIPGTESQRAFDVLEERFPSATGDSATIIVRTEGDLDSAENRAKVDELIVDLKALPGVEGVASPYDTPGAISQGGNIARFDVQYGAPALEIPTEDVEALFDLREEASTDGFQVELGGVVASFGEQPELGSTEIIGVIAAIIILLIAFGSVVAMGLPIITALLGLVPGFIIVGIASAFADIASFTPQFATMIGLGVGIDYALLIVTRFREGLASGLSVEDAVQRASATAGRSVLFAGSVVVIALLGLWVVGISFVAWLGTAAAIIVAALMIVALLILPAVLRLVARYIDRWTIPGISGTSAPTESSFAYRWSRLVQRFPIVFLIVPLALVAVLASPVLDLRLGSSDAGSNPESTTTRRAYDLLSEGFGAGFNGPILVTTSIDNPNQISTVEELPSIIQELDGVAFSSPATFNTDQTAAIIQVIPTTSPQDAETTELVDRMRTAFASVRSEKGVDALVGGQTAVFIDMADLISKSMPLFFAVVIGLSFLLLAAVFRSVIVPLKAALMIVVSVGAAFGVLVAIFQWGWLGGVVGLDSTGPIESFVPMMLFAVLFGLSMDYEVFLVTRMHEEYQKTGSNRFAVTHGQASTLRLIIAAAAIMISVFLSFALTDLRVIKEFGIGLATAIFVDAFIVRMMLVPAIMHLIGNNTWWFPAWLDKIVPRISVEAAPEPAPAGSNDD